MSTYPIEAVRLIARGAAACPNCGARPGEEHALRCWPEDRTSEGAEQSLLRNPPRSDIRDQAETIARIIRGWPLPTAGQRIGPGTKRAIEEADAKATAILSALREGGGGQDGSSVADGAAAPKSSAPGAVWIVQGTTGEYSDRSEWTVFAFPTQAEAEAYVTFLTARLQEIGARPSDYQERVRWEAQMRPHDPSFQHDYTGTMWWAVKVPFRANPSGFAGSDTTEQSDLAREASENQPSKDPATNDKLSDGEGA